MVSSLRNGFPPFIANLLDQLDQLIGPIHLVGSAVRNVLQGCPLSNDLNILTPRPLEQCLDALRQAGHDAVGGGGGEKSLFVPLKGWEKPKTIEISKFRHRPAQTPTIEEDLLHRDVTVNAMAYAWPDGPLIDPFNGRGDLDSGRIRLVNGEETLHGDPLRAVRLFRFSLQLSAVPNPEDLQHCTRISLDQVPAERIRVELDRIFSFSLDSQRGRELLFSLFDSDLGTAMFPELKWSQHLPLPGSLNKCSVWHHTVRTLLSITCSPREEDISLLDLRWTVVLAGLVFHSKDLRNLQKVEDRGGHERTIHQITSILNRYGFSRRRQKKILNILNNLGLGFPFSDRALKRLLGEAVPIEGLVTVIHHWKRGCWDSNLEEKQKTEKEYARVLERCRGLRQSHTMLRSDDLAVSGGDLREIVRRGPGPWLGELQKWLLVWIGEDFTRNNPDSIHRKVLEWIASQDKL
ncbi:MAG: PolyA pol protein [Magnetococcales bacterium]|nr:PolyA pol protein [Magnetococcales bacterium]HIJ83439.1 CCA tRNA nucleotidyltransferase [Magnetococcales bacterium]